MILLPAQNASLWTGPTGNNTYLVPGEAPVLIDAGVGHPGHLAALEKALEGAPLAYVLVTHGHGDHAGGVPALRKRWPGVRIPAPTEGDSWLGGRIRALHTPGHAPDHYCFLLEPARSIFCGDLVRAGGTIVIPGRSGGHMRSYLESLRRIRDLQPVRLWPAHGPIIDEPERVIDEYLRHRAEREAQVLDALHAGLATPAAIVPRLYGTLPEAVLAAAEDSVLAHLVKLQEDGLAEERDGRWFSG